MADVGSALPVYRGAWTDRAYLRGDIVLYSGALYQAIVNTASQPGGTADISGKGNPAAWVNVTALVLDFTGSDDPTTGAGIPSAISSTYHMAGTGLYVKTGASATSWSGLSGGGLQVYGTVGAFDETPLVQMVLGPTDGETDAIISAISTRGGSAKVQVIGSGAGGESVYIGGEGFIDLYTEVGQRALSAWDSDGSVLRFGLLVAGQIMTGVVAAPADGDLSASQVAFWFDDTDGAAKLKIKGKSANGTVVTGTVNLT